MYSGSVWEDHWMVHNALAGGTPQRMAAGDTSRGLVPWVGIAAHLNSVSSGSSTSDLSTAAEIEAVSSGRAFCFLPLPIATGLPSRVHINGYFELSSNRRDIWCAHLTHVANHRWHYRRLLSLLLASSKDNYALVHSKVHLNST